MFSSPIHFQLLLGIRDCNDELVEMSLYAVAKLVPILGGDIVVGANRGKVFAEGQPKVKWVILCVKYKHNKCT